jgi:hypothetical protein
LALSFSSKYIFFKLFYAGHHKNIYAGELGPSFVKRCRTNAKLKVNIRDAKNSLNAFDDVYDPAISKFCFLHVEPIPLEKILLLKPLVLGTISKPEQSESAL